MFATSFRRTPARQRTRLSAVLGLAALGLLWPAPVSAQSPGTAGSATAAPSTLPTTIGTTPTPGLPEKIRVATKIFRPFVMNDENGQLTGFTIELWDAVSSELKVETEYVMTDSVAELLQTVADGRATVGAAGITVTREREKNVDFSYPYYESGLRILVKQAPVSSPIIVLKTLFSQGLLEAVGVVLCIVLIVAHIMWLVERHKSPEQFPRTYFKGIWEALWWSAVTVTTVGYGDKSPTGLLGRVVGLIWMFAGMVLISYFTAAVTTELTISRLEGSIQGSRDLNGKTVATAQGSTAHIYLTDRGIGTRAVPHVDEAVTLLLQDEVDAVVYDSPVLQYYATHEGNGKVALVGSIFHRESYGFALTEGNPMRERVDQAMLELRENGAYYRIYRKWFGGED